MGTPSFMYWSGRHGVFVPPTDDDVAQIDAQLAPDDLRPGRWSYVVTLWLAERGQPFPTRHGSAESLLLAQHAAEVAAHSLWRKAADRG
jgi:hypothetical protein